MISLKKKDQGFTIVELLIVIVVIGILAAIVITTYSGIQAKARNAKRQSDIDALQTQIEAYYTTNQHYPSLTDMNTPSWLATNMPSLDLGATVDPSWSTANATCGTQPAAGEGLFVATPTAGCYAYAPTGASNCSTTADSGCTAYVLTATLEQGAGTFSRHNLD